jgi:hypothetical protein
MRTSAKSKPTPLAARVLLIVGAVLLVSSILDYLILLIPPNLGDSRWLLNTMTALVDRGIVPMVGIAMVIAGYWVQQRSVPPQQRTLARDPRFWMLGFATAFGLMFLAIIPFFLNGVRQFSTQEIERFNTEAQAAVEQLDTQVEQQRQQIQALLQNPERLNAALNSGQVPEEQVQRVREIQQDPTALDRQAQEFRTQAQQRIEENKNQAIARAQSQALKSSLKTGISSFLLAAGYLGMSWLGLSSRKKSPQKQRKANPARKA